MNRKEGFKDGDKSASERIAAAFLDIIAEKTGLTVAEVKQLREQSNNDNDLMV